ncbi:4-diphosphocytidyl-2C-methyl-D-erythritol kinase [gamma proteobacterium HdN1]|nr:4-diphosphocytidyl-2C-methyl-D-erythritol kinase [gamma proteobacterium HdN1]
MSFTTITVRSPAKLNLFLHITGQRPDGYHDLQTLFQFIDLCDTLSFTPRNDSQIVLDCPDLGVAPHENLIYRAAELLQQVPTPDHTAPTRRGASIQVAKSIPAGGGLGGGSSNAATTLLVLNRLWGLHLDGDALIRLGLSLGADVPIFIHGRAALAEGVGERFENVILEEPWYVLGIPPCHVPTARLFQEKDLTRNSAAITLRGFLGGEGHNDFEPITRKLYPEVNAAMLALERYCKPRMTGTGACVFGSFHSQLLAEQAWKALEAERLKSGFKNTRWIIAKGANFSPLHADLSNLG